MPKGRQTKTLTKEQIERLRTFAMAPHQGAAGGYSLPQLRTAMSAPFGYKTLGKALQGAPVWVNSHFYIVQWLDRYLPVIRDARLAAGEFTEPDETAEDEKRHAAQRRGSR